MSEPLPVSETVTVGLIEQVATDLRELQVLTGLSRTDAINRAISLYTFVARKQWRGKELLVRDPAGGEMERVTLR